MRRALALALVAPLLALAGCLHTPAPQYAPGIESLHVLRGGGAALAVDDFDAAAGVRDGRLSMRGNSMTGAGSDGSFSSFLQQALEAELRNAGRYDAASPLRISGTLTENRLEAGGTNTGDATVAARFVLRRGDEVVFDRTLEAGHEWESSFMGAIAVPAAMQGYAATVQKLLATLFDDPAFREATR